MAVSKILFIYLFIVMGNIQNARIDAHINSLDELWVDLMDILGHHATEQEKNLIKNKVDGIIE